MTPLMARAILGVNREDDFETVKRKWRSLAKDYHPDRGGEVEMFLRLVEAYQYLIENPVFVSSSVQLSLTGPSTPVPTPTRRVSPYYWSEQEWLEQEFGHLGYWTRKGVWR